MPLFSLSMIQLLLAYVASRILTRMTNNKFFLRWLLSHRLRFYIPPMDSDVLDLLGRKKKKARARKAAGRQSPPKGRQTPTQQGRQSPLQQGRQTPQQSEEIIRVPASQLPNLWLADNFLEMRDIKHMFFANELEWVADLALVSIGCCALSQVHIYFFPNSVEWNFGVLWSVLIIVYCGKMLASITARYFNHEEFSGERSLCIVSGCFFLIMAIFSLVADEHYINLGLEEARQSLTKSFMSLDLKLAEQTSDTSRSISIFLAKTIVAVICAFVGVIFTFPGFRFGQVHETLIDTPFMPMGTIIKWQWYFLVPLFISSLWVEYFSSFVKGVTFGLLDDDASFETFKILSIITLNLARIYYTPVYLSCFLTSTVKHRLEILRQRGGKVTNKELQNVMLSVLNYSFVFTVQYMLPTLMCLFSGIILSSTGVSDPKDTIANATDMAQQNLTARQIIQDTLATNMTNMTEGNYWWDIFETARTIGLTRVKKVLPPEFFRGMVGFATFWFHFAWFGTTATGTVYYKQFYRRIYPFRAAE